MSVSQQTSGRSRILVLTEESDRAEAALFEYLAAHGKFEVLVLGNKNSSALREVLERGLRVEQFQTKGRFDLQAILGLRRILGSFRPSLLHAFTSRTLSVATLAMCGHSIPRVGYRGTSGHLSRLNPVDWLTYLSPTLHGIMCVSDAVRRYLLSLGIAEEKLVTVHKGHSVQWYDAPKDRGRLNEFGIPVSAITICALANMRPVKGIDVLLDAAKELPRDGSIHYLLIGDVRNSNVTRQIELNGIGSLVHIAGFRADAPALVKACDIFTIPSRAREGLPKALIEAMLSHCPVVASSVGGIPEVIRGETDGILVPPDDPPALARALERLVRSAELRSQLATAGYERVQTSFSVAQAGEKLCHMYERLITNECGTPR